MAIEREVSLKVTTQSDGGDEIKALVAQLEQLAAQGGDAAPELQRLAAEIKQLDQARTAANSFVTLRNATTDLARAVDDARAKANALVPGMVEARNTTLQYSEAQSAAARAVEQTDQQIAGQRRELEVLRAQMREAGGGTAEMVRREHELRDAIKTARGELSEKKKELTAANQALTSAARAEKELSDEQAKATATVDRLTTQLASQKQELSASALKAKEAGVNLRSLSTEQDRLKGALAGTIRAANQQSQAIEGSRQKSAQLAQAAKAAADSLNNAFAVVGVRSANAIQREITEINQALMRLANSSTTTGAEFDRAFAAGRARIEQLRGELRGTGEEVSKVGRSASAAAGMMKQLAAAYGGIELARQFIIANVELENNVRALKAVTGSAQAAARELAFIRQTANRLGVDVNGLTKQYIAMMAASKGTALEGEKTRQIFESVANAMVHLGRGSVETERAFMAIAQMMSKGTISMEEVRQQLGEQLPGALQAFARGLGITEAEFIKLVSSGRLLSEELPALAAGLDAIYGKGREKLEGFQAAWNRLKQALSDTSTFVGDLGLWRGLTDIITYTTEVVRGFIAVLILVGKVMGAWVATIVRATSALSRLDFKDAKQAFKDFGTAVVESMDDVSAAYMRARDGATQYENAAVKSADTAQRVGVAGANANAAAQNANADATLRNADAQAQSGQAAAQAGDASAKAGMQVSVAAGQANSAASAWVSLTQRYENAREQAEQMRVVSIKVAEAKKLEGEIAVQLAQLTGNEVAAREASLAAAQNNVVALQGVQQARATESAALRGQIAALIEEAGGRAKLTKAKEDQVRELEALLKTKEADTLKSIEATNQAKMEAAARSVAAEAYKDNAAKLGEYRAAAEAARVELERLVALERQGIVTSDEVASARIKAAEATALYRDALEDAAAAEDRKIAQMKRDADLSKASLQIELERAKTAEKSALAYGREREAIAAKVQQKQIEIRIVEANAAALRKEAAQIEAAVAAKRAELEASGQLTPAKEAELQARLDAAKAARLEADRSGELVKQLRIEIDTIYDTANAKKTLADANREVTKTLVEQSEARKKFKNDDPTDFEYEMSGAANIDFEGEMYRLGASVEQVKAAMQYVNDLFKQQMVLNPIRDAMFAGDTIKGNITRAVEEALQMGRRDKTSAAGGAAVPVESGPANRILMRDGQSQILQPLQPVNINIGGVQRTVQVATQGDVTTLEQVLRQLVEGATRS